MDDANPEGGAETATPENAEPEATPETGAPPPTSTDEAAAFVSNLLSEPPEGQPEAEAKEEPDAPVEETPEAEPQTEAEPEKEEVEAAEEAEPEEILPETFDELAEALEMKSDDLAESIKVRIKVDGEESLVTLGEATKGYQRETDYRQKTAALADERRAHEAQKQESEQSWQQKLEMTDTLQYAMMAELDALPNDEALVDMLNPNSESYDPEAYQREKALADMKRQKIGSIIQSVEMQKAQQAEEMQARQNKYREEQQALLAEAIPELKDPEKAPQVEGAMRGYLRDSGFSDDEVNMTFNGPYDHRHMLIVRDAMRYRAQQKAKPEVQKKLKNIPKMQKPGAAPPKGNADKERSAAILNRLRSAKTKQSQTKAAVEYVKDLL